MSSAATGAVAQYLDAAKQGDLDTIVELTHADCVISEPSSLPYGGEYAGKNAFAELFADVLDTWETFDFEEKNIVTDGDTSLIIFDVFVENEAGESLQTQVAELYQFEDDLIKRLDVFYEDTASLHDLLE